MVGPQAVVQIAQLGYGALTARILSPSDFGSFATALAAVGLLGLFATVGLDAALSRSGEQTPADIRSMATVATLIGAVLGIATMLLAGPWATLWGDPSAAGIIRVMAIGLAFVPLSAVVSGVSRHRGRFRQLALLNVALLSTGMVVAVAALLNWGSPIFLPIPGVAVQCGVPLLSAIAIGYWLAPGRLMRSSIHHLKFGSKALITNLIEYSGWMVLQFAVSRGLGAASLGQLNRASVFSVGPLQGLNSSLSMVLYPEFGDRFDAKEGPAKLQQASVVSAWLGCIAGPLLGGAAFVLIPLVLGPAWKDAAALALVLSVGAGAAVSVSPLAAYMQASDQFRPYWSIQVWTTLLYVAGAAYLVAVGNLMVAAVTFFIVNEARWLLVTAYALRRRTITRSYFIEIAMATLASSILLLIGVAVHSLIAGSLLVGVMFLILATGIGGLLWLNRGQTSIAVIARHALSGTLAINADGTGTQPS